MAAMRNPAASKKPPQKTVKEIQREFIDKQTGADKIKKAAAKEIQLQKDVAKVGGGKSHRDAVAEVAKRSKSSGGSASLSKAEEKKAKVKAEQAASVKEASSSRPKAPSLSSPLRKDQTYIGDQYRMDKNIKSMGEIGPVSSLVGQYDTRLGGVNPDKQGIEAFRKEALRTGPSAWMNQELARSKAEEGFGLQDIASSGAGAAAQARAGLAAKRGLSSGAAERIGMGAGQDTALNQQRLRAQGMMGRMGISSQDEANRMQMLGQLPGKDLDFAQFDMNKQLATLGQLGTEQQMNNSNMLRGRDEKINAYQNDIANSIAALGGKTNFDTGMYDRNMKEWGAEQTANAMAQGGSPGMLDQFGKMNPMGGAGLQASLGNSMAAGVNVPYAAVNSITGGKLPSLGGGGGKLF